MKAKITLLIFTLFSYIALTGYSGGPGTNGAGNRTGSPGSAGTCSVGTGCHSAPPPTATVASFSFFDVTANSPAAANTYIPGHLYTVTLSGSNVGAGFTQFGFQTAAMTYPGNVSAGTFIVTNSIQHQLTNVNSVQLIEHNQRIQSPNTNLSVSFNWQAPSAGVGAIRFYGIINGVDGNFQPTNDRHSGPIIYQLNMQPLSLARVIAEIFIDNDRIVWRTSAVHEKLLLDLQRSINGQDYLAICTFVADSRDSAYSYDIERSGRPEYYRIRVVNEEGSESYSRVVFRNTPSKSVGLSVYPNPAKNELTVLVPGSENNLPVYLYDLSGRVVCEQPATQGRVTIDVRSYPAGVYFVRQGNGNDGSAVKVMTIK
jgi:hypothetical protein